MVENLGPFSVSFVRGWGGEFGHKTVAIVAIGIFLTVSVSFIFAMDDADALSGLCGDDVRYELNDGVLVFEGSGPMYDYKTYLYRTENWQSYSPFSDNDDITTVLIGEGITYIGDNLFYNSLPAPLSF